MRAGEAGSGASGALVREVRLQARASAAQPRRCRPHGAAPRRASDPPTKNSVSAVALAERGERFGQLNRIIVVS